ncbi:uncharacterized protein SOCEGT47_084520 [Sorangium cellulosum]|uniref:PEGA domain-containing protein n=1 Tax=Sorangium cellulosum TaxID=56 RepID=A0A4P2QDJ0_SORCE|nr:kelch repeat-containing protein [Sorangium cellulosum]AUX27854.1 uncharacterized protein SOCEGT47_084520 [Sorangium cellulosum]
MSLRCSPPRAPLRSRSPLLARGPLLALAFLAGCGAEPEPGSPAALRRLFPEQAAAVLAARDAFVRGAEGFHLGPAEARGSAGGLHVVFPCEGGAPIRFRTPAGVEVRVRELGAAGEGVMAERAVSYRRAGGTSFWAATDRGVEEWLLLEEGIARGGEAVAAWHVEGATLRMRGEAVELADARSGAPMLRVTAPRAHAASGRPVAMALRARGARIELVVDAGGEAALVDPVWEPASGMNLPRTLHTATLLRPSGQVLVAGGSYKVLGFGALVQPVKRAELYDPVMDAWTDTGAMIHDRRGHTATLLPNGKVLVAGGESLTQAERYLPSAELYDPVLGTWTLTDCEMGTGRYLHTATLLDSGKVLVTGGYGKDGYLVSAELYDPEEDTWTSVRSMHQGRDNHTATRLLNGRVLVAGGEKSDSATHDTAELYDPEENTWMRVRPMNVPRQYHTATLLLSGKVLVAGGTDLGYGDLGSAELYDPEENSWTLFEHERSMLEPRTVHAAARLPDGQVLLMGGKNEGDVLASVARYDPESDTWTGAAPMARPRAFHTATLLPSGEILVAGGLEDESGTGILLATHSERYGLVLGDACAVAPDVGAGCRAGAFCVDGICCDSPCPCGACSPEGHCSVEGSPAKIDEVCEPPVCDGETHSLGPARCSAASAACPVPERVDCITYRCDQDSGACETSCASIDDCAPGFVCNLQGHCVLPPPAPSAPGGCSAAPARPAPGRAWAPLALLLALGAARRRRAQAARGRRAPVAALCALAVAVAGEAVALAQPAAPEASPASSAAPPPSSSAAAPPPSAAPPDAAAPPSDAAERPPAEDPIAGARAHFERGVALYRQGAWEAALAEFLASRQLYPTWSATSSAALCLQQLRRYDEALALFETLLNDFSERLPQDTRTAAQEAIVRLRGLIGTIDITGAEIGASITIDGRRRGDYPMPAPLRVGAGSHVVRVYKEGFEPFEMRVDVAGGQVVRILSRLHKLVESGRLRVAEQNGKVLDVLVDGYTVGKTPWEGPISPGQHTVALRGPGELGTMPASVLIRRKQTTPLTLRAEELTASLRIVPTPVCASVTIDGVTLGNGIWEGHLSPGRHRIEVAAGGFVTARREVILARDRRAVIPVALERVVLGAPPGRFLVELTAAPALVPSLGGGAAGQCGGACSLDVGVGGLGVLHAGYELWSGLGFGVTTGYLQVQQAVAARSTSLQIRDPLPESTGTADDALALRGFLAGGWSGLSFGERVRLSMRLGAGALFAAVSDERSGTFTSASGVEFRVDRTSAQGSASFFVMTPEVRAGLRFGDHLDVTAGLAAAVLIRLTTPVWSNAPGGVYGRIDADRGYFGAFDPDPLVGEVTVALAPGVGARYTF